MIGAGHSAGTWEAASVAMALTVASAFAVALALGNEPYEGFERVVQSSAAERADLVTAERIAAHTHCLDFASRAALHARRSYLRAVDVDGGPTGREPGVWLGALDASRCAAGLEKARNLKPALPELDRLADAYLVSLERLSPLLNEASAHHGNERHQRDYGAKAKVMNPALMAAFADFEQAHAAFAGRVRALDAGIMQRRLERLEREPSARLEYLVAKTVHQAQALRKPTELAVDRYAIAATDYERHVAAHPDEASKVEALSLFRSQVGTLLKSATEQLRSKRAGNPVQAASVAVEVDELVSRWHRMRFPRD